MGCLQGKQKTPQDESGASTRKDSTSVSEEDMNDIMLEGKQQIPQDRGFSTRKDSMSPVGQLKLELLRAAEDGDSKTVADILRMGAPLDHGNEYGETPLHNAAEHGHTDTVQVLLRAGANVDVTDEEDNTPLHNAAQNGHTDTVQVLLQAGATVDATDRQRDTPLLYGARNGHTYTVKVLLQAGAKVDGTNVDGDTPLLSAAMYGQTDTVQELLGAGANVDVTDRDGDTPLHHAAYIGHRETMQVLLQEGPKVDVTNKVGETPLGTAIRLGHIHTAELLVQSGADVSKVNQKYQKRLLRSGFITKDMLELGQGDALNRLQERIQKGGTLSKVPDDEVFLTIARCILLGLVGAGKSSLLKTMIANKPHLTKEIDRTIGIEVHGMKLTKKCKVWWYDSGGHQSYHHTNQLFLSPFSLFNVVVDLSEYKTDQAYYDKAVGYWINITTNRVPSAAIKVVATHVEEDLCSRRKVKERCNDIIKRMHANEDKIKYGLKKRLDQIYNAIESKAKNGRATGVYSGVSLEKLEKIQNDIEFLLSHRPDLPDKVICISSKTKEGIEQFKSIVAETISSNRGKFPSMSIPTVWWKIEEELVKAREQNTHLTLERFHELASIFEIKPNSKQFEEMVVYFQITGTIIYYNIPELKEYVFHHPHWLLQTLGNIFHHNLREFQHMPSKVIKEFEKLPLRDRDILLKNLQERAWIGKDLLRCLLAEFNPDEKLLSALEALLMKFDICHKLHEDEIKDPVAKQCGPYLCIPALAPDELPPEVEEMMWPKELPEGMSEYRMVLKFESQWLPAGLFGIIAVRFSKHITSRRDWKGGFVGVVSKEITTRVTEYHDEEGNAGLVFAMRAPTGYSLRYSEGMVLVLQLNELVLFYPGAHSMLVVQCSKCIQRSLSDANNALPPYYVHTDVFLSEDSHTIEYLECPNCKNTLMDPKLFFPVDLTDKAASGGITPEHRKALKENRVQLRNNMDAQLLMPYIIANDVFDEQTEQDIQSKSTRYGRNEALLDSLPLFGDKAFFAFCEALQHVKQTYLVDLLIKDALHYKVDKDRCVIS